MPITRNKESAIVTALGAQVARQLINLLNAQGPLGPVAPSLVNNTQPTYVADTEYSETVDGVLVTYLTVVVVQEFWEVTLSLLPKHINALQDKGITYPKDLAQFNSKEFDMVIQSIKGKAALLGLAQIKLKQVCDFFQFIRATGGR